MNSNVIKELFIIGLLFIVVIFTLVMLFFDSINVDVQNIDKVKKKETTDFDNLINEVDLNSNNEDVNVTKSVSREDLEKYRNTWTKKEQLFETTYKHDILSKVEK